MERQREREREYESNFSVSLLMPNYFKELYVS
jgi:hypothetical protein